MMDVVEAIGGFIGLAIGLLSLAAVTHTVRNQTLAGTLGRNHAIGIRTKATMASDAAWWAGHRAAAPWMLAAARTGYTTAAVTTALIAAQLALGETYPLALVVPGGGFTAVLAAALLATRKANRAARATES